MKRFGNDNPLFSSRALTPARQESPFGSSLLNKPIFKLSIISTVVVGFFGLVLYSYVNSQQETTVAVLEPATPTTRVRPADPEGMDIPHRDRLIYNRLSSNQNAERLDLPPRDASQGLNAQRPVPLDDLQAVVAADTPPVAEPLTSVAVNPLQEPPTVPLQPVIAGAKSVASVLPDATTDKPAAPVTSALPAITPPKITAASAAQPVPKAKPTAAYASITPENPVTPPAAKQAASIATAPVSGSGFRVQLASFRSEAEALKGWQSLQKQHAPLASLRPTIEKAEIAGRGSFHRLQTQAFANKADADALCADLKKAGRDCLVVKR